MEEHNKNIDTFTSILSNEFRDIKEDLQYLYNNDYIRIYYGDDVINTYYRFMVLKPLVLDGVNYRYGGKFTSQTYISKKTWVKNYLQKH